MESSYIVLFIVFLLLMYESRRKKLVVKKMISKKSKNKETTEMTELAKRFIGHECVVYTFSSQLTGTIEEVNGNAIILNNGKELEAVNLDYVVRIRDYPKNKKGKKVSIITD